MIILALKSRSYYKICRNKLIFSTYFLDMLIKVTIVVIYCVDFDIIVFYCGEFAIVKIRVINLSLNTNVFKSLATFNTTSGKNFHFDTHQSTPALFSL
jgi:hypothetical protein